MINTKLPNGAIVKAYAEAERSGVVLAETHRNEWVTWVMRTGDPASTYWGHYFTDYDEAAKDFVHRVQAHV